eukprot:8262204-Pyramimonas_sp.AAC.1
MARVGVTKGGPGGAPPAALPAGRHLRHLLERRAPRGAVLHTLSQSLWALASLSWCPERYERCTFGSRAGENRFTTDTTKPYSANDTTTRRRADPVTRSLLNSTKQ